MEQRRSATTRRRFLARAAGLAAAAIVPRHVLAGGGEPPPSDRPSLAGVGVGGVGFSQLQECEKAGFEIAIRTGKLLEWDGAGMRFTNAEEADRLLAPEYRPGWSLEG